MVDLLVSEVNQALRADKLAAFWQRGRKPIFYACIAAILFTAASSVRDHFREQKAEKAMEQLASARDAYRKGDYAAAVPLFHTLVEETSGDLNDMARLWEARALTGQGKKEEAAVLLVAIASDPSGHDLLWRDLACLRLEGLKPATVPASCSDTKDSPLRMQRHEWRVAEMVEQGKLDEARKLLKSIIVQSENNASERARAQALLASLGEGK